MKKSSIDFMVGFIILFCCTCKLKTPAINEVGDKDLTLQVSKLKTGKDGQYSSDYAVRLIPAKKIYTAIDGKAKTALCYGMDSSFYLLSGTKKIYSDIVQPIANGVTGSFEYLLSFNNVNQAEEKLSLVYEDKYIDHKKYTLKLVDE